MDCLFKANSEFSLTKSINILLICTKYEKVSDVPESMMKVKMIKY